MSNDAEAPMSTCALTVNGAAVSVPQGEPLAHTLRERLGHHSVRETCGIGVCGSCTVLVDGRAVSSCLLLNGLVAGQEIVTAEGLAECGGGPVQEAFVENEAFQCSYCIPAMTVAAHALLAENTDPDEATVREHLAGNLCRCGTHPRILAAVMAAAGRMGPAATLARLGYDVGDAPLPSRPARPVTDAAGLLHVSGQIPLRGGALLATGTIGADVDLDTARRCAAQAAANALAHLHSHAGGLTRIRAVKLTVFVVGAPGFTGHSEVGAAASDLLITVLGEHGQHSRSVIGVAGLPRRSPVEVELVAARLDPGA
ncbi:MAG TPA: Atu1372/SO_1960 family protein [Pseudonocardia sp.]|uniref:Atu1372/SO_1960 family protein n=1 Tax=Pseudonocardia sp. TaxID=60912 RepID=UPI002B4ADAA7|nr:Atu1372/SO_1960 family protein [Pseudonocardia sp.]HLU54777.1 Atu1372/SO_1960 family protein [Pseudonocardia sp.]